MKYMLILFLSFFFIVSCQKNETKSSPDVPKNSKDSSENSQSIKANNSDEEAAPLITFIELGSDKCIPCKKMQPILKSIEQKYGSQLKIIFYDVQKDEFKSKADEYSIKLIPTQVFLDKEGKEIMRHEGYFPEEEIIKFLESHGLKIKN